MELKQYLIPLRKWWWLLVAATLVSTLSAFVSVQFQPPMYRATSTLMIGQAIERANPSGNDFFLGNQLAQAYAEIARMEPVRQGTMEALGLTWLPEYSANVQPNNQLLRITVVDSDPVRAQVVANTLAAELVKQSPTSDQQVDQQRQQFIAEQMNSLEARITETEGEISDLQASLSAMNSARQIADTQTQITALETKLNTLRSNYGILLSNSQTGAVNVLRIIEEARVPTTPVGANKWLTVLLGAAIGLVLSGGAAYLMEYLDDTFKTPDEVSAMLKQPVIGFVSDEIGDETKKMPHVADYPRSAAAEAFRILRTNLEFASVDSPLKTILITSPGPAEGKSTVAANLAVVMAQGGKRTVLLDCDLRRPRVHRQLNLPNQTGLSDLFRGQETLESVIQETTVEGLFAITSGPLPPNPAELLNSAKMSQILADLEELTDVIILDSPPSLVSDSIILAGRVGGVILIIKPGFTHADAAKALVEQLSRAGANMLGVVMNHIPHRGSGYYGGYRYYYSPYYEDNQLRYHLDSPAINGNGSRVSRLKRAFQRSEEA